ncbi:MAG: 30S ribosomal protein S12 methylthiotransferase RimO [Ignavibacteria bacterium]|nr:30S ribosomal protein S12 methylthiotransferase RimO [Ignavibacteria bacterium]
MHGRRKQKVHVVTMGCAKNVVDSERLMAQLNLSDIEITSRIEDADVAVINTCGFIGAAKEQSIDAIIETVRHKSRGSLKKVYAMGCLTERYREELAADIPELDGVFGSNQLSAVARTLGAEFRHELLGERVLTTPSHFAYLKISEGCDNPCSFCAIPLMRGKHVSRPTEALITETQLLSAKGVKEVVIIGQDTTYYGMDLYGRRTLADLLRRVADVPGIEWVRLMYAYPTRFPQGVLDVIADHPRLCKYLDIPVQHASDRVLRSMRRGITRRAMEELINRIRDRVPGVAIRSTLIVGYPNETVEDFDTLLDFVEKVRFERLGVFTYSQEEGTTAFPLGDLVPQREKERRLATVMALQQEISRQNNELQVHTRKRVLIDRVDNDRFVGRTQHDAPEIDNEVVVSSKYPLAPGTFHDVEIVDAVEYDLFARA